MYRGDTYSLTGVNGDGLFSPDSSGLTVQAFSTACWRGYVCDYEVSEGGLTLTGVDIGLCDESGNYLSVDSAPALFGVRPRQDEDGVALRYGGFGEPVDFTGGLLIGQEFVDDYYVHMGFQAGWKYESLYELLFEQGRLVAEHERSAAAAALRALAVDDRPDPSDPEAVRRWVERSFTLDYDPF
ncbi:MAG: hypothetical protein JWN52_5856 [Actinomycetia bacterium]|nr:hypothetical protein [Actinomycetes bacterium]